MKWESPHRTLENRSIHVRVLPSRTGRVLERQPPRVSPRKFVPGNLPPCSTNRCTLQWRHSHGHSHGRSDQTAAAAAAIHVKHTKLLQVIGSRAMTTTAANPSSPSPTTKRWGHWPPKQHWGKCCDEPCEPMPKTSRSEFRNLYHLLPFPFPVASQHWKERKGLVQPLRRGRHGRRSRRRHQKQGMNLT